MYNVIGISKLTNNIFEVENDAMRIGARAVMVPGVPAGLCLAHEQFGILPREQIMEPAITMALHGFDVNWDQTLYIANIMHRIQSVPIFAELWLPNGRPPRSFPAPGDTIIQPELGRLLERIASEGSKVVYEGKLAASIVEWIRKRGGIMTQDDLAKYQPKIGKPMTTHYREYEVMTVPAPIGGQTVLETLNILENFDLPNLQHNSSEYLHLLIECARHAFADRYQYLGDWEVAPVPIQGLLSKKYSTKIAQLVDLKTAALDYGVNEEPWSYFLNHSLHDPWEFDPGPRMPRNSNVIIPHSSE